MNRVWTIAFWILFACWTTGAVLFMLRVKGGFPTSYLADITFPAWFYIYLRGLWKADRKKTNIFIFRDWFGNSPERALISILLVGVLTELKTFYLPTGIISGTFDPFDIIAYAVGLLICYFFDKIEMSAPSLNSSPQQKA